MITYGCFFFLVYKISLLVKLLLQVFFIESICDDPQVVEQNVAEVKVNGPDYCYKDPEIAMADFKERIVHYESAYQTIDSKIDWFVSEMNLFAENNILTMILHLKSFKKYF